MAITLRPLDQQVVVIIGAGGGCGLATARLASARGARVVGVVGLHAELAGLTAVVDAGRTLTLVAEPAERRQLEEVARMAVAHFGRIDTWVNAAAVSLHGQLDEVSEADNRRLFDINFWGMVNGTLAALPRLRMGGGALISLGDDPAAVLPLEGMYTASKHAVKGFTDALRAELHARSAPVSLTLIQPTLHASPRVPSGDQERDTWLPGPQLDPTAVAEAILHAAVNPQREVKVDFHVEPPPRPPAAPVSRSFFRQRGLISASAPLPA